MTDKEFFEKTIKDEIPRFERVFKAIPDKPKDLRPHPRNQNAQEISKTLVFESSSLPAILEIGEFDFGKTMPGDFKTVSDMARMFKQNLEKAQKMAATMSDKEWGEPAAFLMNGKVEWNTTKGTAVWGMIFDAIHHRGQLSTHIRPHGGKVPSIYGPSGDSESMMEEIEEMQEVM